MIRKRLTSLDFRFNFIPLYVVIIPLAPVRYELVIFFSYPTSQSLELTRKLNIPKPIKNLELQYPMIQFLIIVRITFGKQTCNVTHTAATVGFTTVSPAKLLIQQLMNEAEQDMKNYADRGWCQPPKPNAEMDTPLPEICIMLFSKIQLVVYHQCCFLIGYATTRLYVIAQQQQRAPDFWRQKGIYVQLSWPLSQWPIRPSASRAIDSEPIRARRVIGKYPTQPNSLTALFFIQNNSQFKNKLKHA